MFFYSFLWLAPWDVFSRRFGAAESQFRSSILPRFQFSRLARQSGVRSVDRAPGIFYRGPP